MVAAFWSSAVSELWRGELYVATAASLADRWTRLLLHGIVGDCQLLGGVGLNCGSAGAVGVGVVSL